MRAVNQFQEHCMDSKVEITYLKETVLLLVMKLNREKSIQLSRTRMLHDYVIPHLILLRKKLKQLHELEEKWHY